MDGMLGIWQYVTLFRGYYGTLGWEVEKLVTTYHEFTCISIQMGLWYYGTMVRWYFTTKSPLNEITPIYRMHILHACLILYPVDITRQLIYIYIYKYNADDSFRDVTNHTM